MKISIIGTGYVGLPTGVGFAELGHDVVCVDKIPEKIAALKMGKVTLFEEGLEELLLKNLADGRIQFTTDMKEAISGASVVIIAVGTPPHSETREADMKYIHVAAKEIAPCLDAYTVIAIKSTVPVGTGDYIEKLIGGIRYDIPFDVVSMPEFLREGFAVHDFFHPDRIIIGTDSSRARSVLEKLYAVYPEQPNIVFVRRRSAETIKYVSNAFLAVKVHYINEISELCRMTGADIFEVVRGMGLDSRIGSKFLNPGPGYGGSCFPKDTVALAYTARQLQVDLSILETTIKGNENRKQLMAKRIIEAVYDIEEPLIAVWGLAFKSGTDDVRESPAMHIIEHLLAGGSKVIAFDPKAQENAQAVFGNRITYAVSAEGAADGADILAVLTEWDEFGSIDLSTLKMRTKRIVDLRNVIDKETAISNGFQYQGIVK